MHALSRFNRWKQDLFFPVKMPKEKDSELVEQLPRTTLVLAFGSLEISQEVIQSFVVLRHELIDLLYRSVHQFLGFGYRVPPGAGRKSPPLSSDPVPLNSYPGK